LTSVINDSLLRGDFFLCASERQRDFWLGSLSSLGRVNAKTYDEDASLRRLIDVVPFGISEDPPQRHRNVIRGVIPGIAHDDLVLLWAGGVYNWFDPVTLVEAVDIARHAVSNVRLVFLGMTHPNPAVPPMRVADEVRARADDLELTGAHVFFNEGWVPYDERANYLLEADIGVSTHRLHIETAFAFRTRVLDYLWAGLPVILSEGDVFADLVGTEGFGLTAPPGDAAALAASIIALARSDLATYREQSLRLAKRFHWTPVLEPLGRFCDAPYRAPDRVPSAPRLEAIGTATTETPQESSGGEAARRRWFRR
jgi:glycosyltransferase involved in cell wall biosynthesis